MRLETPLHVQLLRLYVVWWRVRRYYYEVGNNIHWKCGQQVN